jgi:hypothetical protein
MISENKRLEFWNFLIAEKNQPRPKGITTQRLAVIRPVILGLDDVWFAVIGQHDAGDCLAADFYGSNKPESVNSRMEFWAAVRSLIRQGENKKTEQNQQLKSNSQSRLKSNSRKYRR